MNDTVSVLTEIFAERVRQDEKWGLQNWVIGGDRVFRGVAGRARDACEQAAQEGTLTWRHILHEEFWETFAEPDSDPLAQRAELVQVAAVAVAMIECIDRKERLRGTYTIETRVGWGADAFVRRFTGAKETTLPSGDGAGQEEGPGGEEAPPQDQAQDVA